VTSQLAAPTATTTEDNACVLLVETDRRFAREASADFWEAGYEPIVSDSLQASWQALEARQPALVVVDGGLAGEGALEFCRQVRDEGLRVPVLLAMARDTIDDRAACLAAGADDYVLKPYRPETFWQLVDLYLSAATRERETEQLQFGDLTLDLTLRRAVRNGRAIELTVKEFELLRCLMVHAGQVLTREQILEAVWGDRGAGESNVIEVYIRYLRLKLESEGEKRLIQTVRGVGYALREA